MCACGWEVDKRWSDQFIPEIKAILGTHLIGAAPEEDDRKLNTDLIVLKMEAVRIGCRIRRPEYLKYKAEFTIREDRPSGADTELLKIMKGWGDYFFYGFGGDGSLLGWSLCNLHDFRGTVFKLQYTNGGRPPGLQRKNGDGSSTFRAYRYDLFPEEFVVASAGIFEMAQPH